MYSWSRILFLMAISVFAVSCGSSKHLNKKNDLSYYLVELGDRQFSQGEYKKALRYYGQSIDHNKNFKNNIYIVSRIIKSAIKSGEPKAFYDLIKNFEFNSLRSSFEKEVYHYTIGKYFLYLKDKERAKSEFNKASKFSELKREPFYQCLIDGGDNCLEGPLIQ